METRVKRLVLLAGLSACAATWGVEMAREGDLITIRNARYEATFDVAKGGSLAQVKWPNGARRNVRGFWQVGFDAQPETYNQRPHGGIKCVRQLALKDPARVEVVKNAADAVVLRFSWPLDGNGETSQTLTADDSGVIRVEQAVSWSRRLATVEYCLVTNEQDVPKGCFWPESRSFTGVYDTGARSALPGWKLFTDGKIGLGLIACGEGWDCFNFQNRSKSRNWANQAEIDLRSDYLASVTVPSRRTYSYAIVLDTDVARVQAAVRQLRPAAPEVELCDLEPDKVNYDNGEAAGFATALVNNTDRARKVRAVTEIAWGLGDRRTVNEQEIDLKPWEIRPFRATWTNGPDVDWGVETVLAVYDEGGRLLDRRGDVVGVHDNAWETSCLSIVNPGFCNHDGQEAAWADHMRRRYVGLYEWYVWMPATWDPSRKAGLSPKADTWEPMTESSAAYRCRLTKKFLKGMVDESHKRGVKVVSLITGLCNYRLAYAYPDMFKYNRDGELSIYNGRVWGKDRFAVAMLAPYTEEACREWGDQMADSVDMFGWDGCRWDWGFLPCAVCDPLYTNLINTRCDDLEWFDSKGRSNFDLYGRVDDELAAKLTHAWVSAVTKRHPKFMNCANLHASDEMFAVRPEYFKQMSKDSKIALFEYLLDVVTKHPTYSGWAKALTTALHNVRPYGAQGSVGQSSSLCAGSVGERLARFACVFSGCKWWNMSDEYRYWGARRCNSPFSIRFAEYLFSTDLRQMPAERRDASLTVAAADGRPVMWKEFVVERDKGGKHEVVVNLLNTDPDQYISVRQNDPAPVDVTVAAKGLGRLDEAWALVPGVEPLAVRLEVGDGAVTVPQLGDAASLVLRFAK